MRHLLLGFAVLLLRAAACAAGGQGEPASAAKEEVSVPRVSLPPRVDGVLDDACWREAVALKPFTETDPDDGAVPDVETDVLLGYDDAGLYISFVCHDDDMSALRASGGKRDQPSLSDDQVFVKLDPYDTRKGGYDLWVNPYGVQVDCYYREDLGQSDIGFDLIWEARTQILADRWIVEIAIPFKSIRFPAGRRHAWGADFWRYRPRESEYMYGWIPHPREEASIFENLGVLLIEDTLLSDKKTEILPYIVGGLERTPGNNELSSRSGFSGKYRLRSDIIFDWAARPDFSQIEADAPQVDVNTTQALYYTEKRPFFLERKEMFTTPIQAVYTRAINDPLLALKMTARVGNLDIGYVGGWDDHTPWVVPFAEQSETVDSDERSVSSIIRTRYDLSNESSVGVLLTSRELESSHNRVAGVDGRLKILKNSYLSFQGVSSWTKEPDDTLLFAGCPCLTFDGHTPRFDGESYTGQAYWGQIKRRGEHLEFQAWYNSLSPGVRLDNGYVSENDFVSVGSNLRLTLRPKRWGVATFSPGIGMRNKADFGNRDRQKKVVASLGLGLSRENTIEVEYSQGSTSFLEHHFDDAWNASIQWYSGAFRRINPVVLWSFGRDVDYFASPPNLGKTMLAAAVSDLKIARALLVSLVYSRYILWQERIEDAVYDASVLDGKILVTLSEHLRARLSIQYSSDSREIRLGPLLLLEVTPFTVFYLGSSHTLEKTKDGYGHKDDDRIYVKLQYLLEI